MAEAKQRFKVKDILESQLVIMMERKSLRQAVILYRPGLQL